MKKIYYTVQARYYEAIGKVNNNIIYHYYCYNEGNIIMENGKIAGYLTLDSMEGIVNGENVSIKIHDYDNGKHLSFSNLIDDFQLPGNFILFSDDNRTMVKLSFEEMVKDRRKQEEIEKQIKEICE